MRFQIKKRATVKARKNRIHCGWTWRGMAREELGQVERDLIRP